MKKNITKNKYPPLSDEKPSLFYCNVQLLSVWCKARNEGEGSLCMVMVNLQLSTAVIIFACLSVISEQMAQVIATTKKRGALVCPVCPHAGESIKRHVYRAHLPYFWRPHRACWQCGLMVESEGRLFEQHLNHPDHRAGCRFDSVVEYLLSVEFSSGSGPSYPG